MAAPEPVEQRVELLPITRADIDRVAAFLQQHLDSRLSAQTWATAMAMPWHENPPNHGFLLQLGDEVVGVNLAFYARRSWGGKDVEVCNVGALCVRPDQRQHVIRLLRAVLGQRGYEFTDFSPSGNVVALNRRLGFVELATTTLLVANLPWPRSRRARLVSDPAAVAAVLSGADAEHHSALQHSLAVRHLALVEGDRACHIALRLERRKGLPLFVSVLHVSDPELFQRHARLVFSFALLRLRRPVALVESRIALADRASVGRRWFPSLVLARSRPKMLKSRRVEAQDVDYLFSELTEVPW